MKQLTPEEWKNVAAGKWVDPSPEALKRMAYCAISLLERVMVLEGEVRVLQDIVDNEIYKAGERTK